MKTFNLKEETINNVLNYLATQPFNKVNQLIGSIQQECQPQIEPILGMGKNGQIKQEVVD